MSIMYAYEGGIILIKSYHFNKLFLKKIEHCFYWLNILRVVLEAGESKKKCKTHVLVDK